MTADGWLQMLLATTLLVPVLPSDTLPFMLSVMVLALTMKAVLVPAAISTPKAVSVFFYFLLWLQSSKCAFY